MSQSESRRENLRQRRSQILQDKKEDARIQLVIQDSIGKNQFSKHLMKTFLVIITALFCTIAAVLNHTRPRFLERFWKQPVRPFHLATRYPKNIILDRDLPRFFGHYSIATPENLLARQAVQKVLRSRKKLRSQAGPIKSTLKAWDDSNVEQLLKQGICGDEFELAYRRESTHQGENGLLMWCLLASQVTEGFFTESVEILDSILELTRNRGIVVRKQPARGIVDGYDALSTTFYLRPRTNHDKVNWIPTKMLSMFISSSNDERVDDNNELAQRMLYELVVNQGNEEEYLILEEICQETPPKRSIAFDTTEDPNGCYFVVPNKYGGIFGPEEDE